MPVIINQKTEFKNTVPSEVVTKTIKSMRIKNKVKLSLSPFLFSTKVVILGIAIRKETDRRHSAWKRSKLTFSQIT